MLLILCSKMDVSPVLHTGLVKNDQTSHSWALFVNAPARDTSRTDERLAADRKMAFLQETEDVVLA